MANVLFANPDTWGDLATVVSVGNELAAAPATNLLDDQPTVFWQSSGLSSLFVVLQLTTVRAWNTIAVLYSNASSAATWRIRAASTQGNLTTSPDVDVGSAGTLGFWASPNLDALGWTRRHSFYKHSTDVSFEWLRIDITDTANSDGFFRAGRLIVADAWQPSHNYQYGATFGAEDDSVRTKTLGGQTVVRAVPESMQAEFSIAYITKSEAMADLLPMRRTIGAKKPLLVVMDPDDTSNRHEEMYYGLLISEPVILPAFNRYGRRFSITEMR